MSATAVQKPAARALFKYPFRGRKQNEASAGDRAINFAAFLPDCVRNAVLEMKARETFEAPYSNEFSAVTLVCEISYVHESIDAFCISEKYSHDVLVELNLHIIGIIKRIVIERGDIVYMENGFVESVWPVEDENIRSLCRVVLNTALAIQKEFRATKTRVGYVLQNKIGIAVGNARVCILGTERLYYVVAGDALREARDSLSGCSFNHVATTKEIWTNIENTSQYNWKQSGEKYVNVFSTTASLHRTDEINKEYYAQLRPFSADFADVDLEIRNFSHPFYKYEKTRQDLEKVACFSQTVFLAVRMTDFDVKSVDLLQKFINLVDEVSKKFKGVITKVIYQKDPVVCIVFGLPGFRQKDDPVRSISCAQKIAKSARELAIKISIGIASGMTFCGVLGTVPRQECFLLGISVQVALSIVDQVQDTEISCDTNIVFRSIRTLGDVFMPLKTNINGFKRLRLFYEVLTSRSKKAIATMECFGRKEEKHLIRNAMKELRESMDDLDKALPLITITGKLGAGKSTMLTWALQEAKEMGYRITALMTNSLFGDSESIAWSVVKQILDCCLIDRESKVLDLLGPTANEYPLHLLNKRMNASFRNPFEYHTQYSAEEMITELIRKCAAGNPVLIAVENAEYATSESWKFLRDLLKEHIAVVITTLTRESCSPVLFVNYLINRQYLEVKLGPASRDELGAMACHVLHVDAFHKGFLKFLEEKCLGNPLRLQEILMQPALQKHYCFLPYPSVSETILQKNFVFGDLEDGGKFDSPTAKICDIADPNGLQSIEMADDLQSLIKEHTTGLNPEEQMLMRKCSLFEETFCLRILETVCPEYFRNEIFQKVQSLVMKNILTPACPHWEITGANSNRKLSLREITFEYCGHPLRFVSAFLRRCVIGSMEQEKRQSLHKYLSNLLREETNKDCNFCRMEENGSTSTSLRELLSKQCKVPKVDYRLCQCLNMKMEFMIQEEYQLQKGNAPVSKRIHALLKAAEKGLQAGAPSKVDEILNTVRVLKDEDSDVGERNYLNIVTARLRTRLNLHLGNIYGALYFLKRALSMMDIAFPNDLKSGIYTSLRLEGLMRIEECRCLILGCNILNALSLYDDAVIVGKCLEKSLCKDGRKTHELLKAKVALLHAVSKTEPRKKRELTILRLISEIRLQCSDRVMESPVLDSDEMHTLVQVFKTAVQLLFETGQIEAGKDLGRKSFQILKIVNHPTPNVLITFWLANIYFYEENYKKCLEMMSQLQDAFQQSGESISEVIYYAALAKFTRRPKAFQDRRDLINICNEYAARGRNISSFHKKHSNKIFCFCSLMALWCMEQNLQEAFPVWYDQALHFEGIIRLNDFWSISGSIYLVMAKIMKMQATCFMHTWKEAATFKQWINKMSENIRKQAQHFAPVLIKDVKEIEICLQSAMREWKSFKD